MSAAYSKLFDIESNDDRNVLVESDDLENKDIVEASHPILEQCFGSFAMPLLLDNILINLFFLVFPTTLSKI